MSKDLTLLSPKIATALAVLIDAPFPPTKLTMGIPVYPVPADITRMLETLPFDT